MFGGVLNSFSKVIFCWEVTRNFSDFFALLMHAKKFRHSGNVHAPNSVEDQYKFEIQDEKMNFILRRYSGDLEMFFEVFWKQTYSCPGIDGNSIRTIVDLGANVGMASAYFHSRFPNANVYCVEPDPENIYFLTKNLEPIFPDKKLQVLRAAAGPAGQKGSLITSRFSYNHSIQFSENAGEVDVLDMDAIFRHFGLTGVDLIKIDIEGAESFLFENSDWLKKVNNVIIEFHVPEVMNHAMELFRLHGFTSKASEENEMLLFASREKIQTIS